uniref:Uncharacterized protein n=1 Tax=Ditylenchus dipsaci TaxID=166011 RepID=A0A915EDJ4_9BILA
MVNSEDIFTPQLLDNIKFGLFPPVTGLPPLNYYVWLVQLQTLPARRIIQVFTMNDESSNGLLDTALNETPRNCNQQQQSSLSTPSGDMTTGNYRFELPTESGEDINQIHRFLRANTDNAIATAATIAFQRKTIPPKIMISYDNLQPVASNHEETTSTVHTNTSDSDSFTDGESSTASSNSTTTSTGSHTNQDSMTTDEEELELLNPLLQIQRSHSNYESADRK